MYSVHLSSDEV